LQKKSSKFKQASNPAFLWLIAVAARAEAASKKCLNRRKQLIIFWPLFIRFGFFLSVLSAIAQTRNVNRVKQIGK
jgi:hypothetical protein